MKKNIAVFALMLCILSSLFAADNKWPLQKRIKIQGGYESVASISVTPVASQAEAYKIGMPFSIDDPSVQYGKTENGRLIANWNTLANFKMLLDIEAEVMHHYTETNTENVAYANGLGYKLVFTYNLSYTKGGSTTYKNDEFSMDVNDKNDTTKVCTLENIDLLKGSPVDPGSLVGSADGQIYFSFDNDTSTNIIGNKTVFDNMPNGNYLAKVTFYMKAKEE